MKLYQPLDITIDGLDEAGRGTAQEDGKRLAVPFAFPGDVVRVIPRAREHGVLVCAIDRLITASSVRIPPRCPHASQSGGCFWQVVEYGTQLEWKRARAAQAFAEAGIPATIPPPMPSGVLYEFRNKMEYAVGEGHVIGTKAPGRWWEIVDMDGCLLQSAASGEVIRAVRAYLKRHDLPPWDYRRHTGFVRSIAVREGKFTGERMVIIVTAAGTLPRVDALEEQLRPHVTSFYHGVNMSTSDSAAAQSYMHIFGTRYLRERIGDLTFVIHPASFFQTNSYMIKPLLDTVAGCAVLQSYERLLDLYCGIGLFSLSLAPSCAQVVGIELVPEAIEMARENQGLSGASNVQFKTGKIEDLTWVGINADAAIIDPPRAGLHPHVVDALERLGPPRLVYVCCNPRAFAREYAALARAYRITDIRALDLFPHSPHVELVIKMERN